MPSLCDRCSRSKPYTVLFSVATMTIEPTTIGWPYAAPSSGLFHPVFSAVGFGKPSTNPARSFVRW